MTLAHLSDTHLGFRAYGRSTADGINQREVDVMKTFKACLAAIEERDPDLIVHSGDLFHVVRPSNNTVIAAFKEIQRLQNKRGGKPFVIIGGNHDTPRTTDSGNILKLFTSIEGVRVVTDKLEIVCIPELDLEVMCVPDNSIKQKENIEYSPTGESKYSVLALHGVDHSLIRTGVGDLDISETRADRWTYVALGDYHIFREYHPNACYSGSTDFASTNVWEESTIPKRWVWFDTEVGRLEPVPLHTRAVIDLPKIDALKLEPKEVERKMIKNAEWTEDQPIVRQRIVNAHSSLRGRISQAVVREISARALHYQVDTSPPEIRTLTGEVVRKEGRSLEQSWEEHTQTAQIPPEVSRKELAELGIELLKEVEREAVAVEA